MYYVANHMIPLSAFEMVQPGEVVSSETLNKVGADIPHLLGLGAISECGGEDQQETPLTVEQELQIARDALVPFQHRNEQLAVAVDALVEHVKAQDARIKELGGESLAISPAIQMVMAGNVGQAQEPNAGDQKPQTKPNGSAKPGPKAGSAK